MEILQKEMTRQEFLVYVGAVFLTLIGLSSFLKALADPDPKPNNGYGGSFYGG